MKKLMLTIVFSLGAIIGFAQANSDLIGEWYNAEKDAVITIFEEGSTLSGKTTWMLEPNNEDGNSKKDLLNPDESLRSRDRLGLVILTGFAHIAGNVWDNGRLYNPRNGKTYTGMMTLKDQNTLDLRGYIGISLLGKTSTWTRKLD